MTTPQSQSTNTQQTTEVDMSPDAIDRRLRKVSQLYKLGMAIRKARSKELGAVEGLRHGGSNCGVTPEAD